MSKGTVNKVILIGRLGKDPEMKYTPGGTAVVNFSMATNHSVKDQDGNFTEKTEWHRITAFGRQAEVAGEYLVKGKLVYVEGRLQTRSWEDQNGQKRYATDIICSTLQLLGGRGDSVSAPSEKAENSANTEDEKPDHSQDDNQSEVEEEDDLPF